MTKNLVIALADANLALAEALIAVEAAHKAIADAEQAISDAKADAKEAHYIHLDVLSFFGMFDAEQAAEQAAEKATLDGEALDEEELVQELEEELPAKKSLPWKEVLVASALASAAQSPLGQGLCMAMLAPITIAAAAASVLPVAKILATSWLGRLDAFTANLQAI